MFAISHANKSLAVQKNPLLEGVVEVVGDLKNDKMLSLNNQREKIRSGFGFNKTDKVVFVISTWGEDCLFEKMGDAFLGEAAKLFGSYKFILSAHPHQYSKQGNESRLWGEYLRGFSSKGFKIREPDEDWMPYVVAADVVITDQTSLAVHGVLIGKPYVYSCIEDSSMTPGYLPWRIREISPKLNIKATNLEEKLDEALTSYPYDSLRKIACDVNSYPGQAERRMTDVIYRMLGLELL